MGRGLAEVFPHQADRVGQAEVLQDDRDVRRRFDAGRLVPFDVTLEIDDGGGELQAICVEQCGFVVEVECRGVVLLGRHNEVHRLLGCARLEQ